ncbi:hypothetical protein QTO34_001536 [Cnephaeus nilssonii]|uniref:UBP-type domain-containing protein n=1 Tax=Cnephaeus nilssonii TaxID=3371016 RepID=A0AA40HWV2_CNENI|nr:hypothetical protein QTO34_001536 [Eptesicus nilssonii]
MATDMDRCKHVGRLRLAQDHSILNPQKWCCRECTTTESCGLVSSARTWPAVATLRTTPLNTLKRLDTH